MDLDFGEESEEVKKLSAESGKKFLMILTPLTSALLFRNGTFVEIISRLHAILKLTFSAVPLIRPL